MDVLFNMTSNKNRQLIGATVDISGEVLYLAAMGQFFFTDPVIESLTIQGLAPKYTNTLNKALTKVLAEYYKTNPIYTLHMTDTKQAVIKMILKNVVVENQELVVSFGV